MSNRGKSEVRMTEKACKGMRVSHDECERRHSQSTPCFGANALAFSVY